MTDITDADSCAALVDLAKERFGSVDALVQVAAFENAWGGLYDMKFEDWRAAFETNVLGAINVIRPAAAAMKEGGGGAVVLIGSQSMFAPQMPQGGYAASKSALLSAMYYLCDELGPDNIRCNMVIPSWMWGPPVEMLMNWRAKNEDKTVEEALDDVVGQVPPPAHDRGRRGGRRGRLLRLGPRQGRHRAVPARQLGRDVPVSAPKRVVVWGTGFVGQDGHPRDRPAPAASSWSASGCPTRTRWARTSASICGIDPIGIPATDDIDALIALAPDALVHYGPTAAKADVNIAPDGRLPAGRHRRVLDGHDPVGVAAHDPEPAVVDRPHHRGVRGRRGVVLHHRHRPRVRQRPLPHDPDGPVQRGPPGPGPRDPRLHQLRGRLRGRDGHRHAAGLRPRCSSTPRSWPCPGAGPSR